MKLDSNYTTSSVNQYIVYFRAIVISLGGLFFGYNNGCFNTTQEHIGNLNGWISTFDVALYTGLITCFLPLGCMIGSLLSNPLLKVTQSNLRVCLMIADCLGLIGTTVQILDPNLGNLMAGRFISGVSGGLNTSIIPMYLSNFTPVIMRGKTGTFLQTFASLGLFISLSLGAIQPYYKKVPKGQIKAHFITQEITELTKFEKEGAWRLTMGLPIIYAGVRLFYLAFVYKEETPVQMVQHHHLRTLRRYLYHCYTKERADLRFKEVLEFSKTQQEDIDEGSDEEDTVGARHFEFGQNNKAAIPTAVMKFDNNKQYQDLRINTAELELKPVTQDNVADKSSQEDHFEIYKLQGTQISNNEHNNEMIKQQQQQHSHEDITISNKNPCGTLIDKTKPVFKSQTRRRWLGIIAQCSAQLSGLNALMFFSSSIYKANTDNQDTIHMYLYIQGFAIFFFTYIAIFFIEKYGRMRLIMISTILTMIGLLGMGVFALTNVFALSFVFIIFFLFGFGLGLGAVIWPYCAELVNKSDIPICTCVRWGCVLLIGACYRFVVDAITVGGSFFVFLGFTAIAFVYFLKEMKETRGLTPQQIDELFALKK